MGWEPFYLPQPAALDRAGNSEGGSLSHAWGPARFICSVPPPGWVSLWMAGQWPGAACFIKSPLSVETEPKPGTRSCWLLKLG